MTSSSTAYTRMSDSEDKENSPPDRRRRDPPVSNRADAQLNRAIRDARGYGRGAFRDLMGSITPDVLFEMMWQQDRGPVIASIVFDEIKIVSVLDAVMAVTETYEDMHPDEMSQHHAQVKMDFIRSLLTARRRELEREVGRNVRAATAASSARKRRPRKTGTKPKKTASKRKAKKTGKAKQTAK